VGQWLRAEKDPATVPVAPRGPTLSPASSDASSRQARGPLGAAIGSPPVLAGDADADRGSASMAAVTRHPKQSPKPSVAPPGAATPPPIPEAISPSPTVQTRVPDGGASAASGGGVGSVAASVVADLEALALALATMLLVRFSLDRATWRSTLLASRLEHPG